MAYGQYASGCDPLTEKKTLVSKVWKKTPFYKKLQNCEK